jgi:hypothetical protein
VVCHIKFKRVIFTGVDSDGYIEAFQTCDERYLGDVGATLAFFVRLS